MNASALKTAFHLLLAATFITHSLPAQVETGQKAPLFTAVDDEGNTWNLADHIRKETIVLFFYPAAMTGGCTKQACGFRDQQQAFADMGAIVVGISGDNTEGLSLFKQVHKLNFPLLSDESGSIAKAYGVPTREGGSLVRTIDDVDFTLTRGVTASRWTFVINKKGKIVHIDKEVDAENDSRVVLDLLKSL